ncbi:hypothetical protein FALCPG4_001918 [Fusarium falciforme]|uniref:Gpi anchored serine-threonine rich protein n=1 Tax=Fusarium falciforme TaxID=195108 RepID=A0A9W8RKI6_9HYPO|nr:hypothetical protein NW755_001031 [Fusarium falciforme]KAJ4261810.1 hypothetical protein NW757_000082 [Fusarium falciforme]
MNKIFLFALSATGVLAANRSPLLAVRQVVTIPCSDQGLKDCGTGCIQQDWTCCPSKAGGCPPTAYCDVGANGEYGCCPNGSQCGGDGGANTRGMTNTIVVPGRTTTIYNPLDTEEPQGPIVETQTSLIVEVSQTTIDIPISQPNGGGTAVPSGNGGSGGSGGDGGSGDGGSGGDGGDGGAAGSSDVPPVIQTPNPNPEPNPVPVPGTETASGTPVPVPVPTPVTVNAASSNGYSWIGGVVAGLAALLL